jgi:hypothetical protein
LRIVASKAEAFVQSEASLFAGWDILGHNPGWHCRPEVDPSEFRACTEPDFDVTLEIRADTSASGHPTSILGDIRLNFTPNLEFCSGFWLKQPK